MKNKLRVFLLLIIIALPTLLPYFNNKFFYTQDYIFVARLQQMNAALSQGQFPVRWAPDLRYGEPIFNYYAPLPYYLGALIHLTSLNFIWVAKILFMLSAILSAVSMYVLGRHLFGHRAGILAAVLYTYAPYKALDMYIRGSLSETWAFVFFPLIFYCSSLLVKQLSIKNVSWLALSLAGLALTHNVTTLMFLPFLGLWWFYLIIREGTLRVIPYLFLAAGLGIGLSAFFLFPASFERDLIQTKYLTVGYFDFRIHFVAVRQFFSLFWGYGSSTWGPKDGLSFQIGWVNVIVLVFGFLLVILHRKNRKLFALMLLLGISFVFSIFLQHSKSDFIWEAIPVMAFIQFPWRFLGISIFIISLVGATIAPYLKNRLNIIYFILIFLAIVSTVFYFKPKDYVNDNFFDKFLKEQIMHQGVDLTKDYLPIWVQTVDGERFDIPRAEKGEIAVSNFTKRSTRMDFSINAIVNSLVEVPITYFPDWEVKADNRLITQKSPSKLGLIRFELPKGNYQVQVELKDTQIRNIGNIVSLLSWLIVIISISFRKVFRCLSL